MAGSLADSVIQTAQQTNADATHTVGDAMQAYHIASSAENARQQLTIQQQENERNKSNWVTSQLQAGAKLPPSSQKIWAAGFSDNLGKLYPNAHPDVLSAIQKDSEFVKGLAATVAPSLQENPSITKGVFGSDLATLQGHVSSRQQEMAMISAAQLKQQAFNGRNENTQDNTLLAVGDKFDKPLSPMVDLGNKLDRDKEMLKQTDPKFPVTYQAVHEVLQNIATVLGNGSISDARVTSITPQLGDETLKKIDAKIFSDPNLPASPKLVAYAQHIVNRLNGSIDQSVTSGAGRIHSSSAGAFHNPAIKGMFDNKANYYQTGKWRIGAGGGGAAPQQAAAPAGGTDWSHVPDDLVNALFDHHTPAQAGQ